MAVDRTKPGNRGTYVAIIVVCALAVLGVLVFAGTKDDATTETPAAAQP